MKFENVNWFKSQNDMIKITEELNSTTKLHIENQMTLTTTAGNQTTKLCRILIRGSVAARVAEDRGYRSGYTSGCCRVPSHTESLLRLPRRINGCRRTQCVGHEPHKPHMVVVMTTTTTHNIRCSIRTPYTMGIPGQTSGR